MRRWSWMVCWCSIAIACGDDASSSASADGDGDGDGDSGSEDGSTTSATTTVGSASGSMSGDGSGSEGSDGSDGSDSDTGDEPVTCVVDGMRTAPADPDHQGDASGANGSFMDACDADGNLLEYVCETMEVCVDPPNPTCTYPQTGSVVPQLFDCDGQCVDGTCNSRCAAIGDMLVWVEVGPGTAVFDSSADDRGFSCTLLFDAASDTFDCNSSPQPGDTTTVTSLGLHGSWCTGGEWGNIGIGDPEQCAYACTYLYE